MKEVRRLVSLGLEKRSAAGIKVRQPLASLKIKDIRSDVRESEDMIQIIRDELNVKTVEFNDALTEEIVLDTVITGDLKEEGQSRELI